MHESFQSCLTPDAERDPLRRDELERVDEPAETTHRIFEPVDQDRPSPGKSAAGELETVGNRAAVVFLRERIFFTAVSS
jgi:hypothetical protein